VLSGNAVRIFDEEEARMGRAGTERDGEGRSEIRRREARRGDACYRQLILGLDATSM